MAKQTMIRLLQELIKNSKRSDRELARIIHVSQPTITRMRKKLENAGYITEYTVLPNLTKLGFEIGAFTFMSITKYNEKTGKGLREIAEKISEWIEKNPKVVFAASGDGLVGKNCMIVSLHKDFTDYTEFITDFRDRWAVYIRNVDSFLVPLRGEIKKHFSFKNLEIPL